MHASGFLRPLLSPTLLLIVSPTASHVFRSLCFAHQMTNAFYRSISWMLALICRDFQSILAIDAFMWCSFQRGCDQIQRTIWERTKRPLQTALMGALINKRMTRHLSFGPNYSHLIARANELESWACQLLDLCQTEVPAARSQLPHARCSQWSDAAVVLP